MQLKITLSAPEPIQLPFEHNHILQAVIYKWIDHIGFRGYLHDHGFLFKKRHFKLFVFSRLMGKVSLREDKKGIIFYPPLRMVIASPVERIINELAAGIMKRPEIYMNGQNAIVETVETVSTVVSDRSIIVRAISPITVYSRLELSGRPYTYYYSPFESRFEVLVRNNLFKKYILVFARPPEDPSFHVEPIYVHKEDQKIVRFRGTIIKGWLGTYRLTGDPRLLELALSAGLGSKNSQGFGCVVPTRMSERNKTGGPLS
ncbi:MAG: CRISPR repeat RNA endoribonuclease Cas6 [Candidatus Carbobacillus altaicus]|uniref:CRISPR-associated endoribonuclease n=1 Tax=Candidatus Carbonibacillus altaicus TaxID=2163959 RepID=A0A2R6XZD6_9BACL|nr:MAG: CRISPR repeat RNA endoribonuclease Cas6 [Candidatus Carbobacillus altaicus]